MRWGRLRFGWPRTLFSQLLLALFIGLLTAQLVGAWLMQTDRERFAHQLRNEYVAKRLASIVTILDRTPQSERARLLNVLNEPPSFLTLGEPWLKPEAGSESDDVLFAKTFVTALNHPAPLQVLTSNLPPAMPHPKPDAHQDMPRPPPFLMLQTRLTDGTVLSLRHAPQPDVRDWPGRTLLLLWVLALSMALLAGWVLRRLTRPLAALADAATGLAQNLNQAPLPETGPIEIARAATAFNAMQRDLRTLIETRDQALAGVSHDLRLPITRLRLRIEQLAEQALRTRIEGDLAEMDSMIGHTLDFLRAGNSSEPRVMLNLDALVDSVLEDFEALGLEIHRNGRVDLPLLARPEALRRCLSNLLENARRYAGGAVDLTLTNHQTQVDIWVEDRGPGIPEADRERVFEPYFRLESSRAKATGGSGLGLAIARAIARAEGGELKLLARAGGGLSARLTLLRQ